METFITSANRGSISTGYDIDNSVKLEDTNNEYLQRPASGSDGSRTTMTLSMWIKRTAPGNDHIFYSQGSHVRFRWKSSDYFSLRLANGHEFEHQARLFRDPSAWYHLVVAIDTTQGTASNRVKIYWNGEQETNLPDENSPPDQNEQLTLGQFSSVTTQLGWFVEGGYGLDGYISEVNYIDGIQQAPTEFGEFDSTSGIWKPIEYTGSYGNEGFYLNFDNSGSLGADSSGNGNNFNLNNIAAADQSTDTPTNNFCTLNPLFAGFQSTVRLPVDGATKYGISGGNQDLSYAGTMGVTKGKWYYENYINEVDSTYGARIYVGFHTFQDDYDGVQYGASTKGNAIAVWQMDAGNYVAWNGGSRSITGSLGTVSSSGAGKFVGIALNLDDNQISFYYDGSAVTNGTNLALYNMGTQTDAGIFAIPVVQTKGSLQSVNFGGYVGATISSAQTDANGYGTFEHAPPSGYYALCSKNLAEYG